MKHGRKQPELFPGDASATQAEQAPAKPAGAFLPDGSWDRKAWNGGPADALVRRLVRDRRTTRDAPAYVAELVRCSQFPALLGDAAVLEQWLTLDAWEDWPCAWTSTSAGEAIKRQGYAAHGRAWAGGAWVPEEQVIRDDRAHDLIEIMRRDAAAGSAFAAAYLDRVGAS